MKPIKFKIADGITLNVISTRKFKTAQLAINFLVPLRKETAAKNTLLSAVLLRGTAKNPTIADISRKLQSLMPHLLHKRITSAAKYRYSDSILILLTVSIRLTDVIFSAERLT